MISDKIKELRSKAGYSQATLAKKLSITRSSVNAWELGISVPSTRYVVELASLFRVSTDYVLGVDSSNCISLEGLTEDEVNIIYSLLEYFGKSNES